MTNLKRCRATEDFYYADQFVAQGREIHLGRVEAKRYPVKVVGDVR